MSTEAAIPGLETGKLFSFADWPNEDIPLVSVGVYTVWLGEQLLYVGYSGRNLRPHEIRNAKKAKVDETCKNVPALILIRSLKRLFKKQALRGELDSEESPGEEAKKATEKPEPFLDEGALRTLSDKCHSALLWKEQYS